MDQRRRDILFRLGGGFGAAALSQILPQGLLAGTTANPLAPKPAHVPAKAKSVIYLFMHRGVSPVDTWDPKPELTKRSGQTVPESFARGLKTSRIDFNKALIRGTPWQFTRAGQAGIDVNAELLPHTAKLVDDLAIVRSCYGDAFDHAPAINLRATGSQFPGRPSLGSWAVYGLGSENQNLPAFVVMSDGAMKSGNLPYNAGYLPTVYQGTVFRKGASPVLHLDSPAGVTPEVQRGTLDFITEMDRRHLVPREGDSALEARIAAYELAYRMQSDAPDAVDLSKESEATKKLYGIGEPLTDDFGRKCLLARRLVERGVRFIQLFSGTNLGDDWDDAHNDLVGALGKMCKKTDQPIAGLLMDLKARGLLDQTLVVWGSEFGRTPLAEGKNGRDHHPYAFSMWMAGGGVKGGKVIGSSDEFGLRSQENKKDVHDVHATILRLMGMDHTRLTHLYQGRDQRLTDVHGEGEFTDVLLQG
ncbi:MAG TPA: DUF1501 domain-containing protein [Bryobacteraceae bacterium]|nr:DUF1501 domain-containing protein [Bryobacteraceae bacterium]